MLSDVSGRMRVCVCVCVCVSNRHLIKARKDVQRRKLLMMKQATFFRDFLLRGRSSVDEGTTTNFGSVGDFLSNNFHFHFWPQKKKKGDSSLLINC